MANTLVKGDKSPSITIQTAFVTCNWAHIKTPEVFQGASTGNRSIVLVFDPKNEKHKETIEAVKSFENATKRDVSIFKEEANGTLSFKAKSKFEVNVVDIDGKPFEEEIPSGSTVRALLKFVCFDEKKVKQTIEGIGEVDVKKKGLTVYLQALQIAKKGTGISSQGGFGKVSIDELNDIDLDSIEL